MGANLSSTFVAVGGQLNDGVVTLPKLATGTPYKAIGFDSSGNPAEINAGGSTLISEETLTGAGSIEWTGLTGKRYYVVLSGLRSNTNAYLTLTVNNITSNTYAGLLISADGLSLSAADANGNGKWQLCLAPGVVAGKSGVTATLQCDGDLIHAQWTASAREDNSVAWGQGFNSTTGQTSISRIKIDVSAGSITGKAALYILN